MSPVFRCCHSSNSSRCVKSSPSDSSSFTAGGRPACGAEGRTPRTSGRRFCPTDGYKTLEANLSRTEPSKLATIQNNQTAQGYQICEDLCNKTTCFLMVSLVQKISVVVLKTPNLQEPRWKGGGAQQGGGSVDLRHAGARPRSSMAHQGQKTAHIVGRFVEADLLVPLG